MFTKMLTTAASGGSATWYSGRVDDVLFIFAAV